jgi:hypothetical protein
MRHSGDDIAHELNMVDSCTYVILVQGVLESSYSDLLSGMAITVIEAPGGPRTALAGVLVDQCALQGVLKHLYDLGLPVLSVTSA